MQTAVVTAMHVNAGCMGNVAPALPIKLMGVCSLAGK
jgi:hypothetical protein